MRPPRHLIALIISLAALLAAGLGVVSADEEIEQPERVVTVLEPGDNLVGWISDSGSISGLFRSIPDLNAIWAFDAKDQRWSRATRPSEATANVDAPGIPAGLTFLGPAAPPTSTA